MRAVIQAESAFNPMARSIKGAMGLMQLMPATAIAYGVTNAYDPVQNIRAGVAYLRSLLERYSQNEELALAAYNAGPTAVAKYGAVPPYRETRNYVAKIRNDAGARPAPTRVYKVVEIKDGREVVRYTNTPPQSSIGRSDLKSVPSAEFVEAVTPLGRSGSTAPRSCKPHARPQGIRTQPWRAHSLARESPIYHYGSRDHLVALTPPAIHLAWQGKPTISAGIERRRVYSSKVL